MTNMYRQLVLKERPTDVVKTGHFSLCEKQIPEISNGQLLLRTIYLSIEPLLRGRLMTQASYATPVEIGQLMTGRALSVIAESKNSAFEAGDIVESWAGWTEYSVSNGLGLRKIPIDHRPLPVALGLLGSSGLAASLSLSELGRVDTGETLVVTSAAGATGSIVVQLGKLLGARVVGIAGGGAKSHYVENVLGADVVIDYKSSEDIDRELKDACPNGIDVYWDCVGSKLSSSVFSQMNAFGRIVIFGTLNLYADPGKFENPLWDPRPFLVNRLQLSGFLQSDFSEKHEATRKRLAQLHRDGKLVSPYVEYQGIERSPDALADLLSGKHSGKVVVKLFDFEE